MHRCQISLRAILMTSDLDTMIHIVLAKAERQESIALLSPRES